MKRKDVVFLVSFFLMLALVGKAQATVEIFAQKTLKLEKKPLDVAISLNGRWIFVLTEQKEILVYSTAGKLDDKISVDQSTDEIHVGPREEFLFLTSRKNKTVQILALDFIRDIDVTDAPFKGPRDAPVTIAVFSDFQ